MYPLAVGLVLLLGVGALPSAQSPDRSSVSTGVKEFIAANYDVLTNAAANVTEQGATTPQTPAAQVGAAPDPGAARFVHVEQDGQIVTEKNGEITLRRTAFTLVVKLPSMSVAKAHVATTPGVYELARSGRSAEMFSESGHGLAEGDRNESQDLFVAGSSPAYHLWFHDGPRDHRFDSVTVETGGVVGRRTVAQLMTAERITHRIDRYPGDTLYLTFRLEGTASRAEFRRQAMKIRFAGSPLPAVKAAPGSADGVALAASARAFLHRRRSSTWSRCTRQWPKVRACRGSS